MHAWLVLLAAGLGVSLAGCGGGRQRSAAPAAARAAPAESDSARAEIARLWDEIDAAGHGRWRGQTGVEASLAATPEREAAAAGAPVPIGRAPEGEAAAGADSGRVSAPASPDAACPAAASEPPACRDSCTLAASICDNAGRICRLAQQLPGDDWAAGKCDDATEVCRQATADCCDCRAGA